MGTNPSDPIVHLDRLTSREVAERRQARNLIFVPHGPISGHGPWTSLGMHAHGAEAIAVLLARRCGGLVYPTVHTCFAGATRLYPGTVAFSYEYHLRALKDVARALHAGGVAQIVLLAFTNPEDLAGAAAARDLYDESQMAVASLVATRGMDCPAVRELVSDYPDAGEALLDYAAMRILGCERPIAEPALAAKGLPHGHDRPEELREVFRTLGQHGATRGWFYQAEREHSAHGTVGLTWRGRPDIELGVRILEALAEYLAPAVEALARHDAWCQAHPPATIQRQDPLPP